MSFDNTETPKYPDLSRSFKVLGENDQMPGGKHQGKMMKDVPADYLLYLSDNNFCSKSVRQYITDHWDELCRAVGRDPKVGAAVVGSIDRYVGRKK